MPHVEKPNNAAVRRHFRIFLWKKVQLIWPILGALALIQVILDVCAGLIEQWSLGDSLYFTIATGQTIGYGDFVPKHFPSGLAAILIALDGVVVMGLIAAVAVRALEETARVENDQDALSLTSFGAACLSALH